MTFATVGVLFGGFARKIDGDPWYLPGGFSHLAGTPTDFP